MAVWLLGGFLAACGSGTADAPSLTAAAAEPTDEPPEDAAAEQPEPSPTIESDPGVQTSSPDPCMLFTADEALPIVRFALAPRLSAQDLIKNALPPEPGLWDLHCGWRIDESAPGGVAITLIQFEDAALAPDLLCTRGDSGGGRMRDQPLPGVTSAPAWHLGGAACSYDNGWEVTISVSGQIRNGLASLEDDEMLDALEVAMNVVLSRLNER